MEPTAGSTYRSIDGDMVDWIAWMAYGNRIGAAEAVLEANRGLAAIGPLLPAGILIQLPVLAPIVPEAPPVVRLWD